MPILSAFGAAKAIGVTGGAQGSVGNYSYVFSSAVLTYPINSAFAIGSNDFSIECFVYLTGYPAPGNEGGLMDFGYPTAEKPTVVIRSNGQVGLYKVNTSGTNTVILTGTTVPLNSWTYIVATRVSGTARLFIGATQQGSGSFTGSLSTGSGKPPQIGRRGTGSSFFLNARISNLRFNVGSGFTSVTIPTQALTPSATTKILTCQSSTVKDNSVANGGGPWTITNSGVTVTTGPF